ncbi:hypothetical protein FH972_008002 [Carpinus fangiana]|uniref:Gnk2-homologous domain-containing protein n=1 Tax=Carpinus fangiana TaxID=176857 RepID=A0A5N6QY59_9ROSI|nr:hypothetical protein FH972_008002 [Carpinus fangiana]
MNPNRKKHGVLSMMLIWWWPWWLTAVVVADPQINLLNSGCSPYNVSNESAFYASLNATLSNLRAKLNNNTNTRFATAQQVTGSAYAMVQCRNYLSTADCLACFTAAVAQIRNYYAANGARVIYDGCFLRYESSSFYDQTTEPGNEGICGNQTASQPTAFSAAVKELLADLQVATPRINGFFAASKKEAVGSAGNATVYAVAQCAETVSEIGCQDCLTVASRNAQVCIPSAVARAVDAGCFLRYSDTPFFADNQTTNLLPFLGNGSSSNKKAIIGGVVGGVVGAILILAVFVWFIVLRRRKPITRGDILGATELRGPVNYKYKDLKSATKNFSEENKLGEGGFGDVYKLSEKVDIYSFGVVVLEIICGQRISEVKNDPNGDYLLERAWKLYENDRHQELVDEILDPNEYTTEEVKGIIEIALLCLQSSPAVRPSMSEVVVLLKSKGSVERQPPSKPAYVDTNQKKVRGDTFTSTA